MSVTKDDWDNHQSSDIATKALAESTVDGGVVFLFGSKEDVQRLFPGWYIVPLEKIVKSHQEQPLTAGVALVTPLLHIPQR